MIIVLGNNASRHVNISKLFFSFIYSIDPIKTKKARIEFCTGPLIIKTITCFELASLSVQNLQTIYIRYTRYYKLEPFSAVNEI